MENLKKWLKDRPCLNLRCIERESEMPTKTLRHYMRGRRDIPEKHIQNLITVLEKYGYKTINFVALITFIIFSSCEENIKEPQTVKGKVVKIKRYLLS